MPPAADFKLDLVWALMRRAALFITEQDGAWQWAVDPPSRTGNRTQSHELRWHGLYKSAALAFAGALEALIGFAGEKLLG
jgi:hypothetical protein